MHNKVIIIGAGRSGTNMLRDVLVNLPGFATWPCDEINYIWRHGNRSHPNDEIPAAYAKPFASDFINKSFDMMAARIGCEYLVEKTCANTLRVPFVDTVCPDAKYIQIVRDGRDVVSSAAKRWGANLDIPYLLSKARFVPVFDMPFYGLRYMGHRLSKLRSGENRLPTWGPIYNGMKDDLLSDSVELVCAKQWVNCVEKSRKSLSQLPMDKHYCIKYEEFVSHPEEAVSALVNFLEVKVDKAAVSESIKSVRVSSVGIGKNVLECSSNSSVLDTLRPMNKHLGYE